MPAWLAAARQAAQRGPAQARLPLYLGAQAIGSVADGILDEIGREPWSDHGRLLYKSERNGQTAWVLDTPAGVEATAALNALAQALRAAGRSGPWRNEQLAVCNADGEVLATVERGAVRVLGIATRAVHLVGTAPDGRMWVQQRAYNKPNNPGMWDTLMGGMVAAADTLAQALQRETWEEAGLHTGALHALAHGGHVGFSQPSDEVAGLGYMVERIDWFRATVPEGLEPCNQDGEVERFALWTAEEVATALAQGSFTPEAALVLAGHYGW